MDPSSGRRLTFLDTPGLDQGDGPRHIVKATEQFITTAGWKLSDIIGLIVTVDLPTARLLIGGFTVTHFLRNAVVIPKLCRSRLYVLHH